MDSFNDGKGPKRDTGAAARVGRLTEERRGEIMTRLNKHRSAKTASSPTGSRVEPVAMTAAQRRERVQQLLLERQQRLAGGSAAKRSSPAASRRSLSPGSSRLATRSPPPRSSLSPLRRVHHPRQGGRARWEKSGAPRVRAEGAPAGCTNPASPRRSRPVGAQSRSPLQGGHRPPARMETGEGAHLQAEDHRASALGEVRAGHGFWGGAPRASVYAADEAVGEVRGDSPRDVQMRRRRIAPSNPRWVVGRGWRTGRAPREQGQAAICLSPIGCTRTGIRCFASARMLSGKSLRRRSRVTRSSPPSTITPAQLWRQRATSPSTSASTTSCERSRSLWPRRVCSTSWRTRT